MEYAVTFKLDGTFNVEGLTRGEQRCETKLRGVVEASGARVQDDTALDEECEQHESVGEN